MKRVEPLKPCPFCGARRPYIARGAHFDWVRVKCSNSYELDGLERGCGGAGQIAGGDKRAGKATKAELALHEAQARFWWNRRGGEFGDRSFIHAAWRKFSRATHPAATASPAEPPVTNPGRNP